MGLDKLDTTGNEYYTPGGLEHISGGRILGKGFTVFWWLRV